MTEPKVVRYHFEPGPSHTYHMAANEIGSWVRHSDYARLARLVEGYRLELTDCEIENKRLRDALKRITLGEGRFSLDHLTHASNTIEDMKEIATAALKEKP